MKTKCKWDDMPVAKRVKLAKSAGLDGKVGSLSWFDLVEEFRVAIRAAAKNAKTQDNPIEKTSTSKKVKDSKPPGFNDFLMWVGAKYYPTYHNFVKEAKALGGCKRIGHILRALVLGKSKVFLVHDEGLVGEGFVFGYLVVDHIEVCGLEGENFPPGGTVISVESMKSEKERGCGWREVGGTYLTGRFKPIFPVLDYSSHKHFRGALAVNGADIMALPKTKAPSDEYPAPKGEPKWTPKQDKALLEKVAHRGDKPEARVFKEFSLLTGHAKTKVAYRYGKLLRETKEATT